MLKLKSDSNITKPTCTYEASQVLEILKGYPVEFMVGEDKTSNCAIELVHPRLLDDGELSREIGTLNQTIAATMVLFLNDMELGDEGTNECWESVLGELIANREIRVIPSLMRKTFRIVQ